MSILKDSFAVKTLNSNGDVLSALNLATGGASLQVGQNKLVVTPDTTYIANGTIKNAMIDTLDAGKIRTGKLDANLVNVVNLNASNITSGKLSANFINGGILTSLNGKTSFNLQDGWVEMNSFDVGIKNRFPNRPLQYLVFGAGNINGVDASYTALLSNRNGIQAMDYTSAGIQIWNGRSGGSIQSAINLYGKTVEFMAHGGGANGIGINTITKEIYGVDSFVFKNRRLDRILDIIFENFRSLDHDGNYKSGIYYNWR